MSDKDPGNRRRWINLGEFIAIAALAVSALGLWNSWQDGKTKPTEVIERKTAIPMVLKGKIEDSGKRLLVAPVESSHSLQQLIIRLPNRNSVNLDGDGLLEWRELQAALGPAAEKKGAGQVQIAADSRYIEGGQDRSSKRNYVIRYRIETGGLFSGRTLRFEGFAPA